MKRAHVEDYPQAMIDGLATAWGIVLGPLGAIILGLAAILIASSWDVSFDNVLGGLLLFPFSLVVGVVGLLIFALLAASAWVFWTSDRYKLDALLAICLLTQARFYTLWPIGGWGRRFVSLSIPVALYALIRFGPALWRRWRASFEAVDYGQDEDTSP